MDLCEGSMEKNEMEFGEEVGSGNLTCDVGLEEGHLQTRASFRDSRDII